MRTIPYRKIIRIISIIAIIFFFIPAFTVSCSGQDISVSAAHVLVGYEIQDYGQIADPNIAAILFLLFPVVMLVVTFIKALDLHVSYIVETAVSIINFIAWIIFRSKVASFASENMCEFKSGIAFYIDLLLMLVSAGLSIAIIANRLADEEDSYDDYYEPRRIPSRTGNSRMQATTRAPRSSSGGASTWECPECGNIVDGRGRFCPECGATRPEQRAPRQMQAAAQQYCPECGKPLAAGARFCAGCGTQIY